MCLTLTHSELSRKSGAAGAGQRQGGCGRDQADSPLLQSLQLGICRISPISGRQQSQGRGQRARTRSSRCSFRAFEGGVPKTSRQVQRPTRPLLGSTPLPNALPGTLSFRNHHPQTPHLSVLKCGNSSISPPTPTSKPPDSCAPPYSSQINSPYPGGRPLIIFAMPPTLPRN